MFKVGCVYRYSFLWSKQKAGGEESGRKDRPVCLLVRSEDVPDALFLFPITSREPLSTQFADRIPAVECRRAGLAGPAWIILDEVNIAVASSPHDFFSLKPLGEFSETYRRKLFSIAKAAIAERRLKAAKR